MRTPLVVTVAIALATILAGCVGSPPVTPGPDAGDPASPLATIDGSAPAAAPLPANASVAGAELLDYEQPGYRTWRWADHVPVGADVLSGGSPRAATTLSLPPAMWLRVNMSLAYRAQGTDLDVDVVDASGLALCLWSPLQAKRAREPITGMNPDETQSCESRPAPSNGWRTWTIVVSASHWDVRAPARVPFEVTITMESLTGPWSDVAPSRAAGDGWPRLEDAIIRPGVKMIHEGGCTANFLFHGPQNASLFLGTAAHCLDGWDVGTLVSVAGFENAARVAYCSWGTMVTGGATGCPPAEESLADSLDNDFAVVELRPDLRHLAHPALLHWGGPTGIAEGAPPGTPVKMFGNSSLRDGFQASLPGPVDPMEGRIVQAGSNEWETFIQVAGGVPGDSGSPIITGDGRALGVLRSLEECNGRAAWQTLTDLGAAVGFARTHGGLDVELATWPLGDPAVPSAAPVHNLLPSPCR